MEQGSVPPLQGPDSTLQARPISRHAALMLFDGCRGGSSDPDAATIVTGTIALAAFNCVPDQEIALWADTSSAD
jgi:hypothetical protein